MDDAPALDFFISTEPAIDLDPETLNILRERMQSANQGRLVCADVARQQIQECLSKSSTTKTR